MGGASRARPSSSLEHTSIPSKRQLEAKLGKLRFLEYPKLRLEQYPVSAQVAAELLYIAGFEHDDLLRKSVVDLGTGTGRLAIGAALMGAGSVVGVDVDEKALAVAKENAKLLKVRVDWTVGRVEDVEGVFSTVVMNPPYGARSRHHDIEFLLRAFQLAPVTYSIHKTSTRDFLLSFIRRQGKLVDEVRSMGMRIPHLFSFHRKKMMEIKVDVYRITS